MNKILPLVDREGADLDTLVYPVSTRARPLVMEEEESEDEDEEMDDSEREDDNISVASDLSDILLTNPPVVGNAGLSRKVPFAPHGIVFLREIRMGSSTVVPRFRDHSVPMVSDKTLSFVFGRSPDAIADTLFKSRFAIAPHPMRTANKTRRTATRVPPQAPEPQKIFDLAGRGITIPTVPRDDGSDVESDIVEDTRSTPEADIDVRVTDLWRQFLVDISAKAPNRKAATEASYCVLTREQRAAVNEETYRNLRLRDYFRNCQYRTATPVEWKAAFNRFWPVKPFVMQGTQNFGSVRYYSSWGDLVVQLGHLGAPGKVILKSIRRDLQAHFSTLHWIPNVQSDRIWYTKSNTPVSGLCPTGIGV